MTKHKADTGDEHPTPAPDRDAAADAVEPAGARVAAVPRARRRAAQAHGLSAARHAGSLRALPVAGPGDPARRRRRHARARRAHREPDLGRRDPPLPGGEGSGVPRAGGPLPPGAELSHDGDDCTFETLVKRLGIRDRRLTRLAEIVHEADLRDGKFAREEARGIDLAIRGFLAADEDDHQVLSHGFALFEGLYAGASRKE